MKLGFVGAGNMAAGLARGWAAAKDEPGSPEAMAFADADPEKARALADELGGEAVEGNLALADTSDLVVLAVKPRVLDEVAADLVQAGTPVLSILAGTTLKTLHEALPGLDLTRVMPNLGAQLRQGVLCVVFPKEADEARRRRVTQLLGLVGEVVELDEELIDTATAIMGCSPGYLALIAEILVELGVERGLTGEQTRRMVAKAMSATGGLLEVRDPGELKQAVASPGGMTEAGLKALVDHDLRETLRAAVDAARDVARR
jgi:pyrroline-5-carboxylate reductase